MLCLSRSHKLKHQLELSHDYTFENNSMYDSWRQHVKYLGLFPYCSCARMSVTADNAICLSPVTFWQFQQHFLSDSDSQLLFI